MKRASADEIEPYIETRVSSSGGGQWTFRLRCKFCEDMGIISAKRHSISNARHKRKAAEKFAAQGWWFDERPICIACHERRVVRAARLVAAGPALTHNKQLQPIARKTRAS